MSGDAPLVTALSGRLAEMPADALDAPPGGRLGAVLVLLDVEEDSAVDATILYTRRQPHLSSHPGQISFPGGRVEPGEDVVDAALREAHEEVGVDPSSVTVLGRLPVFYIPPSRFWMSAVVGVWEAPHDLVPQEEEVAEILQVSTGTLREPERWRAVPLSAAGRTWAWELGTNRLLWGATAVVTGVLLDLLDNSWSGPTRPDDLPDDRVVRPWEQPELAGLATPTRGPRARLDGVETIHLPAPQRVASSAGSPSTVAEEVVAGWVDGVLDATLRMRERERGRIVGELGPTLVLAGPGTIGRIGHQLGQRLEAMDEPVVVVDAMSGADPATLASAGVIVDAMLGRGLRGLLSDPLLDVVRALRQVGAPIVAVDLPTGIHPTDGVVGETVSADITVTSPDLVPGHVAAGALPFVADLYVVDPFEGLRRASVAARPRDWAE